MRLGGDRQACGIPPCSCFGAARRVRVTFTNPGTRSTERHATRSGLCFLLRVRVEKRLVSTGRPTRTRWDHPPDEHQPPCARGRKEQQTVMVVEEQTSC